MGQSLSLFSKMKKNDRITAKCEDYTYDGMGIVKHQGFCVFVRNMIIGEVAEIVITKVGKDYGYGKVLKSTETSSERVQPMCDVYPRCGGCQIQHFSYTHQKEFKRNIVQHNISHIGKLDVVVNDVLGMEEPWKYRNKVQVPIQFDDNDNPIMGFYRVNSHDVIPFTHCAIQSDVSNELINYIRDLFIEHKAGNEFRHIMLRTHASTNEIMVVFVTNQKEVSILDYIVKSIVEKFSNVCSVIQNINSERTNVVLGKEEIVLYGKEYIVDYMNGFEFRTASKSFYQVNSIQTKLLYETAIELAQIDKESKVVDVYCGVGTITMFLAQRAKEVIGIEIVAQAVENAKENAKRNNLDNIEFMLGDAKTCTKKLVEDNTSIDVAVIDPPRKGCDVNTLEALVELSPKRIVYVSCNPATLARDLRFLEDNGYKTEVVQPVDMFPQSYHVETVCVISKMDTK